MDSATWASDLWAACGPAETFRYNTAVMHVNTTVIHNTYVDNDVVLNNTVVNNNHVAYSGGPGGINHPPTAQENAYSHEQHMAPTSMQTQHESRGQEQHEQLRQPQWRASGERGDGHGRSGGTVRLRRKSPTAPSNPSAGNHNAEPRPNRSEGNHGALTEKTYNAPHSNTGNPCASVALAAERTKPRTEYAARPAITASPNHRDLNRGTAHGSRHSAPQPHAAPAPQVTPRRRCTKHHGGGGGGGGKHEHGH